MKRQIWIMLAGAVVLIAVLLMLSPTAFPASRAGVVPGAAFPSGECPGSAPATTGGSMR